MLLQDMAREIMSIEPDFIKVIHSNTVKQLLQLWEELREVFAQRYDLNLQVTDSCE